MSYRGNAPSDSETSGSFGFLKTVVSDAPGVEKNDSDKENDQALMTISEESSETKGSVENSKGQVQGHLSQGLRGFENMDSTAMDKDEDKDMWDEFYNDEDFIVKKDDIVLSDSGIGITGFTTTFEIENNRVLEKVEEEQEGVDERSQGDDYSSTFDSSVKDDDGDRNALEAAGSSDNKRKPRKKKKLFKRRLPPPIEATCQAIGGSHPDLGQPENNMQANQLETMSESGGTGDRGRRLSRRKQAARPRCAGPTPSGDVLQQKYQELEQLVLKPLPNPAVYAKQTRQQMLRLQGLSSHYHASNHSGTNHAGLPPPSGNPREEKSRLNHVIVEENADQGYSTIRTIQVVQNGTNSSTSTRHNRPQTAHPRRPRSGQREVRPASAGTRRPASANHQTRENAGNVSSALQVTRGTGARGRGKNRNRGGRSQSDSSRGNRRSESGSKDRSSRDSRDSRDASSDNPSRSNSRSPRRVLPSTNTHLKYSDNPALRQWLKTKNKQHRQQKLEERKKKREERAEKQEIERKRQEVFQDSDKKVKEWMAKKRKEAFKKAKEEEKRAQEEEMEMIEWKESNQYTGSLRGHSIRRPQSAPAHSDRKMFIPVIRPDGDQATNTQGLSNSETPTPHPPKSKFVYKRPVSGRVRLMKLQQERKEDSKKQEMQKKEMEKLTEEEKNRKMRMSYDQWLLKKRQEDYEKRQKAARERALAKSDPELQRIVPEMARRRIENIQRGKKRIQTNVESIDTQVNQSFGGGNFDEEETTQNGIPDDAFGLQVSGQKKSLGQRPGSAKPPTSSSPLNPQRSKSPRRPKSAHPRVQSIMDDSEEQQIVDAKAFQLPFPPELGVPKYVAERQEKLFSAKVTGNASMDSLPLSTNSKLEDAESQKPPTSAQSDYFQSRETENNCHSRDSETAKFETQNLNTTERAEISKDGKAEEDDDFDSSFFVTDGNVEILELVKEEIVLCEEVEEEAFKDEEESNRYEDMAQDQQEDPESNEDKDTMEEEEKEEEGVADTNIEYKDSEEEGAKMSGVEEEAPTVPDIEIQKVPAESILQELDETLDLELEKSEELDNSILTDERIIQAEVSSELIENAATEKEPASEVREGIREEEQMEGKEVQGEEEEPKSEVSEGKSSTKHVSFVEEAEIHEDPLAGIPPEDYDTFSEDDEAEDERGDFYGDGSPREANEFWENKNDSYDDDYF